MLVDAGKISAEKARVHPMRNVLTLAVGRSREINVQVSETQVQPGDQLLVSSDGLHSVVSGDEISEIMSRPHDPYAKAQALIETAKQQGGPDNISCIVIACL
jgi:protein phosphatase